METSGTLTIPLSPWRLSLTGGRVGGPGGARGAAGRGQGRL